MAQIVHQQDLGERLGSGLGQGIGEGIQALARAKLDRMHRKERYEEAARYGGLVDLNSMLSPQQAQQPEIQEPEITDEHFTPDIQQKLEQYLKSPEAAQQYSPEEIQKASGRLKSFGNPQQKASSIEKEVLNRVSDNKVVQEEANEAALESPELTSKERKAEQKEADKATQKYYSDMLKSEENAKKSNHELQRMIKLIDKGDLPFSAYYATLKNLEEHVTPAIGAGAGAAIGGAIGLAGGPLSPVTSPAAAASGAAIGAGIGAIVQPIVTLLRYVQRQTSPDTEEFEKLSNNMISGAKAIFGARITDQDLKAYMATIPTLSNTDKGKRAIIKNMMTANKAVEIRAKAMKDIIKKNGGHRPFDLEIQVADKIADQLDKLALRFIEGTK